MNKKHALDENTLHRAETAVIAVLPSSVEVQVPKSKSSADMIVNGQPISIKWAGKGHLGDVRRILSTGPQPDIVVAQKMSPGARGELAKAGVSWVDEAGFAEVVVGLIVVSRTGSPTSTKVRIKRWSPSVIAITEAILCGVAPTVSNTLSATGLSEGSCTNALRFLTDQGMLESEVERGPMSARRVVDTQKLLDAYIDAVERSPSGLSLEVGVIGRDPVKELVEIGKRWDHENIAWTSTGLIAAEVIAPLITSVSSMEVYVGAKTIVGLEAVAKKAGLLPIRGGRLKLKPFPSVAVRNMSEVVHGISVAPWPRIYADLLSAGVRGEDAAEHLLEVILGK